MANNIIIQNPKSDDISILNNTAPVVSAVASLNFSSDFVVTNNSNDVSISLPPPISNVNTLYRHNGNTVQTIGTTFIDIRFDTNIINDSDYIYNNGSVAFTRAGRYKISYDVSIDISSASNGSVNRSVSQSVLFFNGVDNVGGRSYGYHRTAADGENTSSATVILNVNIGDFILVRSRRISGGDNTVTLANACRLTIERLS